jgi:hypothetical protein
VDGGTTTFLTTDTFFGGGTTTFLATDDFFDGRTGVFFATTFLAIGIFFLLKKKKYCF